MSNFNEANTVEAYLRDQLSGAIQQTAAPPGFARSRSRLGAGGHFLVPLALTPQRTLP